MIWQIARKELLVNLLSLRFLIGCIVAIALMGLVGFVLVQEYAIRQQTYLADVQRHTQELNQTKVYSRVNVKIDIPPSPLSVFSRGERDLPTTLTISPYHIPSILDDGGSGSSISVNGTDRNLVNPLLRVFNTIDLCFVISIVLSLFSLLLVFDSMSGEREQGTLKLALSAPVGRVHLLLGKLVGGLITVAIPLTIGFVEVIILWLLSPNVALHASDWAGVGLIYVVSLAYLAGFLSLGLLVSLFAHESSTGLMYLLLVWVLVVFAIPSGLGYLARYSYPIRAEELSSLMELDNRFGELINNVPYKQTGSWNIAELSQFEGEALLGITREEVYNRLEYDKKVFPLKFQRVDDRYRVIKGYADRLMAWRRTRDMTIRPSLSVLYGSFCSAITGTNLRTYELELAKARMYRDALQRYLLPKLETPAWFTRILEYPDMEPTAANYKIWNALAAKEGDQIYEKIWSWDKVAPLDMKGMPHIESGVPSLLARIGEAGLDLVLLVILTGVFIAVALWKVVIYPVD